MRAQMSLRRLAWCLWATSVVLAVVGICFLVVNDGTRHANSIGSPVVDAVFGVLFLTYPTVGAAIASREPGNAIGWLFLGAGLGAAIEDSMLGYATHTLIVDPGSLPGGEVAALVADAVWLPAVGAASLLLFVLFPTGRPASPRWRWFVWVVAVDLAVYAVATLVNPGPLYFYPGIPNPWGLDGLGALYRVAVDNTGPVLFGSLAIGLVGLAARFRRATGVERLQMKWLVWSAAIWVTATPGLIWLGEQEDGRVAGVLLGDLLFSLLLVLIPIAVGIAILRHRLYDIDLVIKRTLVYGSLTLTLAASYLGSVLVFQLVLRPVAGQSDLAVAGSTLAVAALFGPLRSRIQRLVDRRFYRSRYDAARPLDSFSVRLRDELDLETLGIDLRRVVGDTMQPAHVSLWLRSSP